MNADRIRATGSQDSQPQSATHARHRSATARWAQRVAAFATVLLTSTAAAAPLVFDFNSVVLGSTVYGNGLGKLGNSTAIGNYMNGVLTAGGYATSSVSVSGAIATKTYYGEGHVVGEALGTSDGGVHHVGKDIFIINNNFGIGAPSTDRFTLTFTNFKVYSLSFDWEIFPDAMCPASSSPYSCAMRGPVAGNYNWPDIALLVDGDTEPVWSALAAIPGPGKDPQGLGTSPELYLDGATTLVFRDWPAEIGIDNLHIVGCAASSPDCLALVPEPSSLPLAVLGLTLGFLGYRRHVKPATVRS